jgi:hypothetical protein
MPFLPAPALELFCVQVHHGYEEADHVELKQNRPWMLGNLAKRKIVIHANEDDP